MPQQSLEVDGRFVEVTLARLTQVSLNEELMHDLEIGHGYVYSMKSMQGDQGHCVFYEGNQPAYAWDPPPPSGYVLWLIHDLVTKHTFARHAPASSTQQSDAIDGFPVFKCEDPMVLTQDEGNFEWTIWNQATQMFDPLGHFQTKRRSSPE